MSTFESKGGVRAKGDFYEDLNTVSIILSLINNNNITDFYLSSNKIMLKHCDKEALGVERLKAKEGKFSLNTYFKSYQTLKEDVKNLIFFTNLKCELPDNFTFQIKDEELKIKIYKFYPKDDLQISDKTNYCYKFEVVEEVLSAKACAYQKFFDIFLLYCNQYDVSNLKKKLSDDFKQQFNSSEAEFERFIKIISEWNAQKTKREKLSKTWVKELISVNFLLSRVQPISFGVIDKNMEILQKVMDFSVRVFCQNKSYEKVKKLWGNILLEFIEIREINQIRRKYFVDSNYIKDFDSVDDKVLSLLLWLMGKSPLIVKEDETVQKILLLCPNKRFILLYDKMSPTENNGFGFKNLFDLQKSPSLYQEVIDNFAISIQGKNQVKLKDFIEESQDFLKIIKTDDLLNMSDGSYNIGEEKEILPEPYIDRYLSLNIIDSKFLEQTGKNTVIIIDKVSGVNIKKIKEKLNYHNFINIDEFLNQKLLKKTKSRQNLEESNIGSTFLLGDCNCQKFQQICVNSTNVHQFKLREDGNLEWIRSEGNLDDLKKYKTTDFFTEEKKLWSSVPNNRINIIISDPGMGKTELMKSFKNNCLSNLWTIILYPRDVHAFTNNSENWPLDNFMKFLFDEKYKTLDKSEKQFLNFFMKVKKVIFVWDALDEIPKNHLEIISNLILQISEKGFFQWITSRRHLKTYLEAKFKTLSIKINQFDEKEQKFYMNKRLTNFGTSEEIEEVIEKIKTTFVLVEHNDILGIPLQIFMITELFRRQLQKYLEMLKSHFTLTDLYHHFIEEKFNIYYSERVCLNQQNFHVQQIIKDSKTKTLKRHEKLALIAIFPENILLKFMKNSDKYLRDFVEKNDVSIGLLTDITNGIPRFIHSSFAEYLTAVFLTKNLTLSCEFEDILFDQKFTNVRFFFDLLLANGSPPHIAVLYKNLDLLKQHERTIGMYRDARGRNALHLASSWGPSYPLLSVKKVKKTYIIDDENEFYSSGDPSKYSQIMNYLLEKLDVFESDLFFGMNCLNYAQKSSCLFAELGIAKKKKYKIPSQRLINILYYSAKFGYDEALDFLATERVPFVITKKDEKSLLHVGASHKNFILKLLKNKVYREKINAKNSSANTALHIASYNNFYETSKILIGSKIDVNAENKQGMTALFIASALGHKETVDLLIRNGAGINHRDNARNTPLYIACQKGHLTTVKSLISCGAKINQSEWYGYTPLHIACYHGFYEIVKHLLISGVGIDRKNIDGFTALYLACQQGHILIVQILLSFRAKANLVNNNGFAPLHVAVQNGHEKIVKLLVRANAVCNLQTVDDITPLYIACQKGFIKIAKFLISSGAKINCSDYHGFTPLHVATQENNNEIVRLLIKSGSLVSVPNLEGFTPLHIASHNGNLEIVQLLISSGARINNVDIYGFTPLHLAAQNGHDEIIQLLASEGAAVNAANLKGFTALHIACQEGHKQVVTLLLSLDAKMNLPNNEGFTPLYMAAQNGQENIVMELVFKGANINFANIYGFTPLHIAAQKGYKNIVIFLIAAKARTDILTKDGLTPGDIAIIENHPDIAEMILFSSEDSTLNNSRIH